MKKSILKVDTFTYKDLVKNSGFNINECWKVVKYLLDIFSAYSDGTYIMIKKPFK